jgi:hypothetical protein
MEQVMAGYFHVHIFGPQQQQSFGSPPPNASLFGTNGSASAAGYGNSG